MKENIEMEFENNNEFVEENNENSVNDDKDPEWEKYCKECDEYFEENESDFDYVNEIITKKNLYPELVLIKKGKNITDKKPNMIILGKLQTPLKKINKSFKYLNVKNSTIFCSTITDDDKYCKKDNCKYLHNFRELPFCRGKCGKIMITENYYEGNCSKRHSEENFDNFLLRKNINISTKKDYELRFYTRPSNELVKKIIQDCKSKLINSVSIKIVEKPKTLNEFLNECPKINDVNKDFLNDEDFKSAWI